MQNYRLLLMYDGSRYKGWQRLGNTENTIQGKLEQVLSRMCGHNVELIGSGRTDAGAHAMGQVANFHGQTDLSPEEVCRYLRGCLPEDIGVRSVDIADPRFHSRYHAKEKTYCYRIWNSETPCVFERRYVWIMAEKLDIAAMNRAAEFFLGTHDFMSFCSNKNSKKSTVRTIYRLSVQKSGCEIRIKVTGDGFLYNMVRIMVGTLVCVGKGEKIPEEIPDIIRGRQRVLAGETAPAKGLCLEEVRYN